MERFTPPGARQWENPVTVIVTPTVAEPATTQSPAEPETETADQIEED